MCSVVSLQFHVHVIIPRRNLRRLRSLEASYHWHFFRQWKKKETTFSVPCILRYLADVSSFEEILTYHISEDCRQLCFWKRAKQPSPGSAISKEEICSLLSFVFAGGVLNSQGRDNPGLKKQKNHKKNAKKYTAHCSILAFRTNCSTLSWLRCAFFRLRLNFAFELLSKEEICSLLSFVFAGGVLNSQGRDNPRPPPPKKKKKKIKGEAFPRPWAQQLEPGKKKRPTMASGHGRNSSILWSTCRWKILPLT